MKKSPLRNGLILNHSSKTLLVIETDSDQPTAHVLGPKRKSPASIDADGFKRQDRQTILGHKGWWKVPDFCRADIWEIGSNFLLPVSIMRPVKDNHFGSYQLDSSEWGEDLAYVTARVLNKKKKVVGYIAEKYGRISKEKAIQLTKEGRLDNVVVAERGGTIFLRTKRNMTEMDNLSA